MITMQQLVRSIHNTDKCEGVITKERAAQLAKVQGTITTYSIMEVGPDDYYVTKALFFSDTYNFGHNVLPKEWVSMTTRVPNTCAPRPEWPSGIIRTPGDYLIVFGDPETLVIETMEELVDYVNKCS